jgi:hypothetical protein
MALIGPQLPTDGVASPSTVESPTPLCTLPTELRAPALERPLQNLLDACSQCDTFLISATCAPFVAAMLHILSRAHRGGACTGACVRVRVWTDRAYTARVPRRDFQLILATILHSTAWRASVTSSEHIPETLQAALHFTLTPRLQLVWFPNMRAATTLPLAPEHRGMPADYVVVGQTLVHKHSLSAAVLLTLRCSVGILYSEATVVQWYNMFVAAAHTSASAVRDTVQKIDDASGHVEDMHATLHELNVYRFASPHRHFINTLDTMCNAASATCTPLIADAVSNPILTITNM